MTQLHRLKASFDPLKSSMQLHELQGIHCASLAFVVCFDWTVRETWAVVLTSVKRKEGTSVRNGNCMRWMHESSRLFSFVREGVDVCTLIPSRCNSTLDRLHRWDLFLWNSSMHVSVWRWNYTLQMDVCKLDVNYTLQMDVWLWNYTLQMGV